MQIDSITSISFSSVGNEDIKVLEKNEDDEKPLICPNFIVVDLKARITLLEPQFFFLFSIYL